MTLGFFGMSMRQDSYCHGYLLTSFSFIKSITQDKHSLSVYRETGAHELLKTFPNWDSLQSIMTVSKHWHKRLLLEMLHKTSPD